MQYCNHNMADVHLMYRRAKVYVVSVLKYFATVLKTHITGIWERVKQPIQQVHLNSGI